MTETGTAVKTSTEVALYFISKHIESVEKALHIIKTDVDDALEHTPSFELNENFDYLAAGLMWNSVIDDFSVILSQLEVKSMYLKLTKEKIEERQAIQKAEAVDSPTETE